MADLVAALFNSRREGEGEAEVAGEPEAEGEAITFYTLRANLHDVQF